MKYNEIKAREIIDASFRLKISFKAALKFYTTKPILTSKQCLNIAADYPIEFKTVRAIFSPEKKS